MLSSAGSGGSITLYGRPGHVIVIPRQVMLLIGLGSGVVTGVVGLQAAALASVYGVTVSACRLAGTA